MTKIEQATSYQKAIEIISERQVNKGIYFLQRTLVDMFASPDDFSLIPIDRGGKQVGLALAHSQPGVVYDRNSMRMSYYDNHNQPLKKPHCLKKHRPSIKKLLKGDGITTRDVVFAEAVVDSQGTIKGSMEYINHKIDLYNKKHKTNYPYPNYHTFALVSKIDNEVQIPGLVYAYKVHKNIWVHGKGCDNRQRGRRAKNIMGVLATGAVTIPKRPYYQKNPMW
jgi:hypothetical protein